MRKLYCFVDTVSGAVGDVVTARNDAEIRRSCIAMLCSDDIPDHVINDFACICIGSFDDNASSLSLIPVSPAEVVLSGYDPEVVNARALFKTRCSPVQEDGC